MQFSDARVTRSGQMRKDVAFSLRNPETVQEYANAVRGAMDFRNQAKRFGRHGVRVKLCVLRMFPARASTFGIGPVSDHPGVIVWRLESKCRARPCLWATFLSFPARSAGKCKRVSVRPRRHYRGLLQHLKRTRVFRVERK